MTTPRRQPPLWPRAAWFRSAIPPALSAVARRRLLEANRGFAAEATLDDLDRALTELVLEPQRLDALPKARRAELEELRQRLQGLRGTLRRLHPRSRDLLIGTLIADLAWDAGDLARLREALGVLDAAAGRLLDEIPRHGGRPPLARRDAVVGMVCGWVASLEATPARAKLRAALTRAAARDPLHVPLRPPAEQRYERQLASVKIVLRALELPIPSDLPRIMRQRFGKKPT